MSKKKQKLTHRVAAGAFNTIETSGRVVGGFIDYVSESDLYKFISEKFGIYWFFERILKVDTFKVEKQVNKFRKKYPDDTPEQLAYRLSKHKAFYTASIGFTSGLIPGNIPALIFDFITATAAQAELIYEIAMVYGYDLEDKTRQGEVLTLIALGAGSSKTAEATMKLAIDISKRKMGQVMAEKMLKAFSIVVGEKIAKRTLAKLIPVLGGVIGASLNASIMLLTGKGAIAFYENLSIKGDLYSGELPDALKNVYNKVETKQDTETQTRDLVIIKTVIFLLSMGEYNSEAIKEVIDQYFAELSVDIEISETINKEVISPSYDDSLLEKIDKTTAGLIIARSIMCINSLGPLNDFQKNYLKELAKRFELPFKEESLNSNDQPD